MGSPQFDSESINLNNSGRINESVLWNELEGWVDQYKKDIEFWGIGSSPIFTVYQDCNGNVERVSVDEDEILKRSGVEPLHFREASELEDFDEVNSKITHAKFLAKEIEGGKNVIPRNSSVAKFMVSGEKAGFVSKIRSLVIPRNSVANVSRAGIAVVCGFVFVWMIRKLFTLGGKEAEVSSFEKEMLRRKVRSRMEKEKLQKGRVEVMEGPSDALTLITERPRLDKEEVLSSIREAKGLNNSLVVLDGGSAMETGSEDVDTKVREIQMMARHAREIERGKGSPSEGDELEEKVPNEMQLVEKDTVERPTDSIWTDEFEKQSSNVLPSMGENAAEEHAGGNMNLMNNLLSEKSAETRNFNGIISGNLETQNKVVKFNSEEVSEGNEDVKPHSILNGRILCDMKSHRNSLIESHDISNSSNLTEGSQSHISKSQLSPPKKTPVRRKPKIIRSVKEAREYLSQKIDQKAQVGDIPTTAAAKDEGMDNCSSQRLGEEGKASKSFDADGLMDPILAPKVSGYYDVKQNEVLVTDINGFKAETESISGSPSVEISGVDTALYLGKTVKISDLFRHSDSHGRSDFIPGENDICDPSQAADKPLLTEESLERVDSLDETPKPNLASGRNASHNASDFTEESGIPQENALDDVDLQQMVYLSNEYGNDKLDGISETSYPTELSEIFVPAAVERHLDGSEKKEFVPSEINGDYRMNNLESKLLTAETLPGSGSGVEYVDEREGALFADKENWLEKNFHEVEPIVEKIGSGFRNNYNVAREKIKQEVDTGLDLMTLGSLVDDTELEWMQDDKLRGIVFKVRENELAGRDPFHSMDPEEKVAFYEGLENKVEKVNQKLSTLHEWLHSNIENLDYGADGISLYDPPEKVVPRWKGPPLDKIPEFLNNSGKQQQVASSLQKENESTKPDNVDTSQEASTSKSLPKEKVVKFSKTVIEASDGSIKPGKRSGKEFWKHTKKWSRGFVESYNAETDPEVKSVMKDIGKDLDRWITEKEIKESADLMDKLPQKGKEIIEKKLNKLRREMELFGPQAVVNKYREYAEEKEEDYLWWLDLPHLLCIELYTYESEDPRVGFYSLEMAVDLELEPKPHHVIAFEDPGDCKNFCYIIQAHLEMLGNGKAFIVPQPPKDVFRQAKANGFGVTVIRKGELTLNVDQPLEEVEELITEIGSKMYHDKIMRERSVDISSLMKGVLGVSPPSKRKRKRRARKRPSKS